MEWLSSCASIPLESRASGLVKNTLSERGSYGTIAKLPLTEGFGELEVARESGSVDHLWTPVEGTLKRLFFEVQDEH